MKIENQVCSLEQGKKLKELGVGNNSIWSWDKRLPYYTVYEVFGPVSSVGDTGYPAYTASELGIMLGNEVANVRYDIQTAMWYSVEESHEETVYSFASQNEAECRADLLISLLESKSANVDFVNQSLLIS